MRALRRFDRPQAISFLHALDASLKGDLEIFVVGGMAAILGYNASVVTADIDVYAIERGRAADLAQAAQAAREATGLDLTIGAATVAELPYEYEARTKVIRGVKFSKLTVTVPDKYDLVLSKTVRGWPHDLDAIRSIHEHHRCSEKTLVKRFETEIWKIANTNPTTFAQNMVAVMLLLYGRARAQFYRGRWLDKT